MRRHGISLLLLAVIAAGGVWLSSLDLGARLSTQVTDLLPSSERNPSVQLVRTLATTDHSRTMLLIVEGLASPTERQEAIRMVTADLRESSLIAEVWPIDAPQIPEDALAIWKRNAVTWFWPQWWESNGRPRDADAIAQSAVGSLSEFLARPESLAWEEAVTADPFLLVPRSMGQLKKAFPITSKPSNGARARLWVRLAVSPFSPDGQQPLFDLLSNIEQELREIFPDAALLDASVSRFAAASEAAIRGEITRLNVLVALSVGGLCVVFLRRVRVLGPLVLIIGATIVCGIAVSFAFFPKVHVLTLVIGSILIGVAIDYGLHVFLESGRTSRPDRLRAVARPLIVGSLSTIGGFLTLTLTSLPVLQQMGTFIAGGLSAALVASLLYARWGPIAPAPVRFVDRLSRHTRAKPILIGFLLLSPLLAGLFMIEWDDDIRELNYPLPEIQANDATVRAAFESEAGHNYLLVGNDWATVQAAATRLIAKTDPPITSLAEWVTSADLAAEAHQAARSIDLEPALRSALEANGYAADAFGPFFAQWHRWTSELWSAARYEASVSAQLDSLPGPASLLAGSGDSLRWWMIQAPSPVHPPDGIELVPLAQLDSLNAVFARYRREAMRVAGIGLAVLAIGLLAGFGMRAGAIVVLLPVIPALLVLGFLGWRGTPLNLFHLLGAFLSVCLAVDYVAFALQARRKSDVLPVSITLSVLTTAASFGWLATSGIPAVGALGATVAPSVLLAWIMALGLTGRVARSEMQSA